MSDRRLIPAHELRMGQRVFVEPQKAGIPRGHKLNAIAEGGQWVQVNDYIHGCVARGAVVAWTGEPMKAEPAGGNDAGAGDQSDAPQEDAHVA